jgi:hypothetical protein
MDNIEIINKINQITKIAIRENDEKVISPDEVIIKTVIERVHFNTISLRTLISEDLKKNEHAIGLICRNLLTDFLSISYIFLSSNQEVTRNDNFIRLAYSDIKNIEAFFELGKSKGLLNKEESRKVENNLQSDNAIQILKEELDKRNLKRFPSSKDIFKHFTNKKDNHSWHQAIVDAYDIWVYLSKYEHIGYYYYKFTRDFNKSEIIKRIRITLSNTTLLLGGCLEEINETELRDKAILLFKEIN